LEILNLQQVVERVKYKRAAIYQRVRAGLFPKPIALGPKRRAWIAAEVDAWVRARIDETRGVTSTRKPE
jgi:prophage regulatory protein